MKKDEVFKDQSKKLSSIIEPPLRSEGYKHALEEMYDSESPPTIKCVSVLRVPKRNTYMSMIVHIKGDKVLKIEVSEPEIRSITMEQAKINFLELFENVGFE